MRLPLDLIPQSTYVFFCFGFVFGECVSKIYRLNISHKKKEKESSKKMEMNSYHGSSYSSVASVSVPIVPAEAKACRLENARKDGL